MISIELGRGDRKRKILAGLLAAVIVLPSAVFPAAACAAGETKESSAAKAGSAAGAGSADGAVAAGYQAARETPGFEIDGQAVVFDENTGFPYITREGRTMLPLRACLAAVGCRVDWDGERQIVRTQKGDLRVDIPIGKKELSVNGKTTPGDTAAVVERGRTYLPLRAVLTAYGYAVDWDAAARLVTAAELTPDKINGGATGIFWRRQLGFTGFDGIEAEVTLPTVALREKGDCPYIYFGFDWEDDVGNAEGGFQFIEDPRHAGYNRWTVFLRQGDRWSWGENISLEQGSIHRLRFFCETGRDGGAELVIELDGKEAVRAPSSVSDFSRAAAKAVISMAMSKTFDGTNCASRADKAKIDALKVRAVGAAAYTDFAAYPAYSRWDADRRIWYGSVRCVPSYLHEDADGFTSIYKTAAADSQSN